MDPHLRPTQLLKRHNTLTDKQAYNEARINGYTFDHNIGVLTKEELDEIASYPPTVDFKRYLYYSKLTKEELQKEFPAISIIIPNVTYEDLFWYATRNYIPKYDSLNYKIERYNKYQDISLLGKSLLDKLYNGNYLESMGHELEKYILAYDQNMDDEAALRSIGQRLGFYLTSDDIQSELYHELVNKINFK